MVILLEQEQVVKTRVTDQKKLIYQKKLCYQSKELELQSILVKKS